MGVGYSASPLHTIGYLEPVEGTSAEPTSPYLLQLFPDAVRESRPQRFRSPSVAQIVTWRHGISLKYRDQLGEDLSWDEASDFVRSEDVAVSTDVQLRFVAAVLDQRSPVQAQGLKGTKPPPHEVWEPIFAEADRRGFSGRFPQLLLGANYWLPFKQPMMIEEPNWNGNIERYGSLPHFAQELAEVRTFIAATDPRATNWGERDDVAEDDVLAAAWQASETIWRLCTAALHREMPLWTTG